MILLQAERISKSFGADTILQDISLQVQTGERIGLVGRNGAGKSTLMKILAGELSFDSGVIHKSKEVTVGYLSQDSGLESDRTIWEEMVAVFDHLRAEEQQLRRLEEKMGDPRIQADERQYEQILAEYARRLEAFKEQGGYSYEAAIRNVLHGLRFGDMDAETPVRTLSGGQKTRLALARLLLMNPDVLLLDEPTNHLDIDTLTWLETYLANYKGAMLVISHDRYFLDKLVTVIYEVERSRLTRFTGNYSRYLDQKAALVEQELEKYERQQEEIARLEEFIARNIARASTSRRAKSRRKTLEKMERLEKPAAAAKAAHFSFEITRVSGHEVVKVEQLAIGYPGAPLAQNITFELERGERVALVGPNGIGKSTLLKTLIGRLRPLGGNIRYGSNVEIGYYDQEQRDLSDGNTVLSEVWDAYPHLLEREVRTLLGNFLFSGDDVQKRIAELSGGERARVSLAKLMLKRANLLVFDEPTNHLDILSKEVLENALFDYPGTVLFVSHDRYFLNQIATRVIELSPDGVTSYLGDYDYYVAKKQELAELAEASANGQNGRNESPAQSDKAAYELGKEAKRRERQRQRRLAEIEEAIASLEASIAAWEEELCQPDVYSDHQKARESNERIEAAKANLESLYEEWGALAEA